MSPPAKKSFPLRLDPALHAALERVAVRRALPWVEIASDRPLTLNLDGEPVEAARFRIDCVPGRVRMHLPADCPLRTDAATVRP